MRTPAVAALAAAALAAAAAGACSCSGSDTPGPGASGGAGVGGAGAGGATTSTSSSSSTSAGAGGSERDWLYDGELWGEPLADDLPCPVHVAKLPSDRVPRRTWTPCGDGCLWAPAFLDGLLNTSMVVATETDGEIYYRDASGVKLDGQEAIQVNGVTRLSDDEPLNLLRYQGSCMSLTDFNSPLLFGLWKISPAPVPPAYFGLAAAPGAPVVWQPPGVDMPSNGFRLFGMGGVWGLIANTATVKVATTPGSSALETVFSSDGYALRPVGRGGQLVWSDWSDYDWQTHRARVRSWTQAGGSVELVGGPYDVMYIALSDTRMVWIGAYGFGSVEGATESEQLFWSPRATDPAAVVIHDGPVVPDTEFTTTNLVTHGDWVATITNHYEVHNAVVVNLASGQIWSIPSRPGKRFGEVMAINQTTLLIDERDVPDSKFPKRLVRLDLSKLDTLTGGLE